MSGHATVHDVAREAGVSIKTVSRVVNEPGRVAPGTRDRVLTAIRSLQYVPNLYASSLKTGISRTVGIVVDSLADPFFAAIVAVVENKLAGAGYTVLVAATGRQPPREHGQVMGLIRYRIAGLILAPSAPNHSYLRDVARGTSLVLIDRDASVPDADVVRADDRSASKSAVTEMVAHGHQRIAFIGDDATVSTNVDRRQGYLDALAAAGISPDPSLSCWVSNQAGQATEATRKLLALENPPTAFFCCHPRATIGTVRALHELRRTDCALISFGDVELGDLLQPALTVVERSPALIADAAADLLLSRMSRADEPSGPRRAAVRVVLPLELTRRGSGELSP